MKSLIYRKALLCIWCSLFSAISIAEDPLIMPDIALTGVQIARADLDGLEVEVELRVHNPNKETLTVTALTYQFNIADAAPMVGQLQQQERFSGQTTRQVHVPVRLPYGPTATMAMQVLSSTVPTPYKIQGLLTLLGKKEPYPYAHEGKLPSLSDQVLSQCCGE